MKNKIEVSLGEEYLYKRTKIKCISSEGLMPLDACNDCFFWDRDKDCAKFLCDSEDRKDKKDVYFVKVKDE